MHTRDDWTPRLEHRRAGVSWKRIARESNVSWGTFARHLQQARAEGWVPPEAELSPIPHATIRPPLPAPDPPPAPLPESWWEPLPDGWAPTIQPFQGFPPAIEAAFQASIERFGVLLPVVKDQYNRVLDGHQRTRVADALDVPYDVIVRRVASEDDALAIAKTLNAERRHLSEAQRREVAFALRQEGHSLRAIGSALGTNPVQIMRDLQKAEAESGVTAVTPDVPAVAEAKPSPAPVTPVTPDVPAVAEAKPSPAPVTPVTPAPVPRVTGLDGKSYPATRPATSAPKPNALAPAPAKPARLAVQDRLVALLARIPDAQAWAILETLAVELQAGELRDQLPDALSTQLYDEIEPMWEHFSGPPKRPGNSRAQRWQDAVETLQRLKDEYENWLDNMPENFQMSNTAELLQAIVDLDLSELLEVEHPRGFGRD